jgi:hypothetical protein
VSQPYNEREKEGKKEGRVTGFFSSSSYRFLEGVNSKSAVFLAELLGRFRCIHSLGVAEELEFLKY